jgi:hypothetical protein
MGGAVQTARRLRVWRSILIPKVYRCMCIDPASRGGQPRRDATRYFKVPKTGLGERGVWWRRV